MSSLLRRCVTPVRLRYDCITNRIRIVGAISSNSRNDSICTRYQWTDSYQRTGPNYRAMLGVLVASGCATAGLSLYIGSRESACEEADSAIKLAGKRRSDLPDYHKSDIAKHNNKKGHIWVTYKNGVYDITDFQVGHPGGERILLAAGGSIEPYWNMYAAHKNPEVFEILEGLRIGNVHPDDMNVSAKEAKSDDPYRNDPERHPALMVNSETPFNAEPPGELLVDNFVTPNDLFFVRNHLPVPSVDSKQYKLEVSGAGIKRPLKLTVSDLKKNFKQHKIVAALQCAGNRRRDMSKVKPVKGLSWGGTAISNAEWTGVKLVDVLQKTGVKEEDVNHVILQGLDKDMTGVPYEASIPAETAFDPRKDVLLVYEMNGEPLPQDHGFPVRVVVPGSAGARQVKWLGKIIISQKESESHWQQNDYKSFNSSTDWHNVDFSKAQAIQEYPIQSAICEPKDGSSVEGDEVTIKGYAWSGGGRGIIRVDVSIDGGTTWQEAELQSVPQRRHQQWAWNLWQASISVPEGHKGPLEIVCKAVDTSYNCQPESAAAVWNLRGLINNAWHKIKVDIVEE